MSERWLLQKSRRERYAVRGAVVEPRGVEPLSERTSTGTSPSADGPLHSLTQTRADTLLRSVES